MRTPTTARLLVGILVAAGLLSACGGSDETATTTSTSSLVATNESSSTTLDPSQEVVSTTIRIVVRNGNVEPPPTARHDIPKGTPVTLIVNADVADEVHVHGYDKKLELQPNTPGTLTFTANIAGVFEVELENASKKLLELQVR